MSSGVAVSGRDVEAYRRDGAVLLRGMLDAEALALLETGIEEAHGTRDIRRSNTVADPAGEGETLVRDYVLQDSPALTRLMDAGLVGKIAAALMDTRSAQLVLAQVFYKRKGAIVPTPWHQDTPFLRVRGEALVRLWLTCDRSPRELTVQVVRGSHRWNVVYNAVPGETAAGPSMREQGGDGRPVGDAWLPLSPDVRRHRDSFDIMSWDVEPGDVLAFQGNMLHGTDGHPGHDHPRRAYAVLLGGPDLRYHAPSGKAFPSPGRMRGLREHDDIPGGSPIGEHENAFPVCWRG